MRVDYLVLSSFNFDRFRERPAEKVRYDEILALPTVKEFAPSAATTGPRIVVVKLTP